MCALKRLAFRKKRQVRVGGVCWIEWRERSDYGKTCGWTLDWPILPSPPCGGCKGCLLKMSSFFISFCGTLACSFTMGCWQWCQQGLRCVACCFLFFFCHRRLECVVSRQWLFLFKTYLSSCKKTKRKSSPCTVHPTILIFLRTKFFFYTSALVETACDCVSHPLEMKL